MKKIFLSLLMLLSICPWLWGQSYIAGKPNITTCLKTFFSHYIFETAYLQFDKPYYAAGDTIYFKAYVTEGEEHKPSELSSVLHVDLISPGNKIDQSIKLLLDSGLAEGDFALPDSLPAGNYRIRAYTQLMRNYGEMDFFDKTIPVGSINNNNDEKNKNQIVQKLPEINQKPDLQFFPEGGNLVAGVRSKVAFKAIDANGLGIGVKGIILDNNNNSIDTFSSRHLGMGYFYLNPEDGKTYKAKLTFADGIQDTLDLPKPDTCGITLTVNNNSPSVVSFKLSANGPYIIANRHKSFFLLIYSGGKAITYNFKLDAQTITLDMQKHLLHPGIARITLFSPDNEPLCERLLFIQNNEQLNLHINTDKTVYTKREKVSLNLVAKNAVDSTIEGHFSVSVIDENKVPEDENNERTILTDLLLTSELKGYVERPNYYFKDTSEVADENLDVLMLTQGYRRFEWKQVMDTDYTPLTFQPERALEISGEVTNLSRKPLANATVNLIPYKGGTILTSVADSNGIFHFPNVVFTDTAHIALNAVNSKGSNSTRIIYFKKKDEPKIMRDPLSALPIVSDTDMQVYLENTKKVRGEHLRYNTAKAIVLREVKVKGQNSKDQYHTESLAGAGHADQVMHADEIEEIGGRLSTSLNGRLLGVGFSNDTPYLRSAHLESPHSGTPPMLIVIDGVEVNPQGQPFGIDEIPLSQVETVEVLRFASASIYGMEGGRGVLVITTKRGDENNKDTASSGVLSIAPIGFYKARKFYSPKYDHTNIDSTRPDLRSTIYWDPEIKTAKDGNASFNYFNADGTGTYKVTIEGIDNNGDIGRVVYRYKVE